MHVFLKAAMEEETVSAIEDDTMSETTEDFKWSSPNQSSHEQKQRNGGREFPQKFKGAVPQPNGNCEAQIYANHQRVWLGTFKSETEAVMAYDSASIKELTPSDVGKLNRLVVSKKYAVKFFPPMSEDTEENTGGGKVDEVCLFFYDRMMRLWKFRYCYWKSSKSFVFTRAWNRFVKEKGLNDNNDIISTYVMVKKERKKANPSMLLT
ncbi:hypothetical protein RHMOL_Rhmol12G0111600 [Rhododendron molle]|uniref:Uncharacterized protein n=1 Tax=Rhododendron molle TaxID=49168 RepID=A0ACC0LH35_RHOML|nr:hypothetical protein RHMOL_Rhmol12G0111600 [Rhododendron molle]